MQPPWAQTIGLKQSLVALQKKFQSGTELHRQGKLADAAKLYEEVTFYDRKHFGALHLLGVICAQTGQFERAEELISKAIKIDPRNAEAYYNRGIALKELKRHGDALASYDKAILLKRNYAEAYYNRGIVLLELFRFEDALASNDKAILLKPEFAEAYNNRGIALKELRRYEDVLVSCDKAIALKPDYAEAYINRGIALKELRRLDEALASYNRAIAIKPDYPEAYSNRGRALQDLKRLDEALASYDRAIALKPDYAEVYLNKSLCLLLQGKLSEGWKLYDWRWKQKELTQKPPFPDKPPFNLEHRKNVLVWAEQGVGDEIMFASLISEFRNLCAKLIVQVDARLIPLFSRSISQDVTFFPKNSVVPQELYDQQLPIGSIAKYLRNDEASFIESRFGYLIADSERTNEIKSFLSNKNRHKICGISWRSKNEKTGESRSLMLNSFLRLLFMGKYEFVSLQYGDTGEELIKAKAELGIDVLSCDQVDNFNDLDGLASLIQACDVVVSVDNTTVHMAGALGKDVRILLPHTAPEWRWQLNRKDSPWYSSATLYRQGADGDWESAFNEIKSDLQTV